MLNAADALFAHAPAPGTVTMDDIASAAGVGKGTLFRAFGSRDGLLDALFARRLKPIRAHFEDGEHPLGPGSGPAERVLAVLDAVITFKWENWHLMEAREVPGTGLLRSPHYVWLHSVLRDMLQAHDAAWGDAAGLAAHALLGALRVDVLETELNAGKQREELRRDVADLGRRLLGRQEPPVADREYLARGRERPSTTPGGVGATNAPHVPGASTPRLAELEPTDGEDLAG